MIATTSSGRRFAPLARYLLRGRSGEETERVAWIAGRNLGLDDPDLAAVLMQATADGNERIRSPVYHLTINFDRHDHVTPEQMQGVADRVLRDLGLAEHQALLVAHQDRAHPHVHIMVNRVHPETHVAWDRWKDRKQIERSLRELERELGLREVRGRLHQLDGQEPPERAALTNGERREGGRTGEPAFPDRVRAHLAELRAARSWEELEATLRAHGLSLERKGQGLIITDGTHQAKASRVARDLSLRRLEERFGRAYPDREPPAAPTRDRGSRSPLVEQVVHALGEHERVVALTPERRRAEHVLAVARERLERMDGARDRVAQGSDRLDAALARVYQDPTAARASLARTSAASGVERAATLLDAEPERFGVLKTVERPRAFGLVVRRDDASARAAAPSAAFHARALAEAEHALATLGRDLAAPGGSAHEAPSGSGDLSTEAIRAELWRALTRAQDHLNRLEQRLARGPSLAVLERSIRRVVSRLEPRELTLLRTLITAPQAALIFQAKKTVKAILLGRDDAER